jgi:hypothetical protein
VRQLILFFYQRKSFSITGITQDAFPITSPTTQSNVVLMDGQIIEEAVKK